MDANELTRRAQSGDKSALNELVRSVQDRVYALCMRMLANPADAEEASQEILVKVITHLSTFRGESAFTTWVHRIAANHLVDARAERNKRAAMSFEALAAMVDAGVREAPSAAAGGDDATSRVLAEEVRITCTQAMLLCLDPEHRIAYVLGEIVELPGDEAAWVLDITPDAFRKRISRARETVVDFMRKRCSVYDAANPCRCSVQVPYTIRIGMLDPARLRFTSHPVTETREVRELVGLLDAAAIHKANPAYAAPGRLAEALRALVQST
jgi:RNA polymerase sigma factor (sigma-70 family)